MSKSRRTETSRKAERQENPLLEAVVAARSDLRALVMDAGFGVLGSLLEEDRAELCGERYARSEQRRAYRHGYDEGSLVMGGRRVKVRKPRARSVDGQELPLPHWERFKATDPLEERAVEQILCGVTTRKYERSLERLDDGRASSGTSRSSVSRRFVARTAKQVQQYLAQPLNEVDLPVLVIDGTHMGKHLLVIAMGIDADGVKHVLGVVEGTTESSHVCRSLLRQLIERGMPVERARLVVIDGSKGLRKAVRDTFGEWALIQRCRVHKIKNVLEHLPGHIRPWFAAKIRKAWKAETATAATKQLDAVVKELETDHPGAAASLREGINCTRDAHRHSAPSSGAAASDVTFNEYDREPERDDQTRQPQRKAVALRYASPASTTSCQHHVTEIEGGTNRGVWSVRWAVTALIEAESKFRRVRGYRDIAKLDAALNTAVDVPLEQERRTA